VTFPCGMNKRVTTVEDVLRQIPTDVAVEEPKGVSLSFRSSEMETFFSKFEFLSYRTALRRTGVIILLVQASVLVASTFGEERSLTTSVLSQLGLICVTIAILLAVMQKSSIRHVRLIAYLSCALILGWHLVFFLVGSLSSNSFLVRMTYHLVAVAAIVLPQSLALSMRLTALTTTFLTIAYVLSATVDSCGSLFHPTAVLCQFPFRPFALRSSGTTIAAMALWLCGALISLYFSRSRELRHRSGKLLSAFSHVAAATSSTLFISATRNPSARSFCIESCQRKLSRSSDRVSQRPPPSTLVAVRFSLRVQLPVCGRDAAEIVDFWDYEAETIQPHHLIAQLDQIFSDFDDLTDFHGVFKVMQYHKVDFNVSR
jgi:hypothetical protein